MLAVLTFGSSSVLWPIWALLLVRVSTPVLPWKEAAVVLCTGMCVEQGNSPVLNRAVLNRGVVEGKNNPVPDKKLEYFETN